MALLAVVQQPVFTSSAGSAASVTTPSITITAGSLVVALLFCDNNRIGTTPMSGTGGQTWASGIASFGSSTFAGVFYAENAVAGAQTFTFTPTSSDFIAICILEVSAVALTSSIGSTSTSVTNTSDHNSGNITSNGTVPEIFVGLWNPDQATSTLPANVLGVLWGWNWKNTTGTTEGGLVGWRIVGPSVTDGFAVKAATSRASPIGIIGFKAADPLPSGTGENASGFA